MSLRELLLILHLLGAFVFAGGIITTLALDWYARGSTSAARLSVVADIQRKTGLYVVVPGAVLALVFGTWLVAEADFDFSDGWISASYVLWLVALALGPAVLGAHHRRVKQHAERLLTEGVQESEDLRTDFNSPTPRAVSAVLALIILAFLYLMVVKPGA